MSIHFAFAGNFTNCHLFLLHGINNSFECFWLVDGKIRQDFAVNIDVLSFHASDELGVGKAKFSGSIVDTGNPEGTKIAFFVATISVAITKGLDNTLLSHTEAAGAIVLHPFSSGNNLLVFCVSSHASFNSHLKLLVQS